MAPPAPRVPKQDWDRVEKIIHNLHYVRKIPLTTKGNGKSVQSIMQAEHKFTASRNQYEAYVKSLKRPKNLKKADWRAVHAKLDEFDAMQVQVRVKLSGEVVSREKLQRSRRHAFCGHEMPQPDRTLSHIKGLVIETLGAAILSTAAVGDCQYLMKLLLLVPEKRSFKLCNPLMSAVRNDKTEAFQLLLDNGFDVDTSVLSEALKRGNKAIIVAIMEANVDVSRPVRHGPSVMELAAALGDVSIAGDLILMGAPINAGEEVTPLGAAVKSRNTEVMKMLLKRGASPSARSTTGITPLQAAIEIEDYDTVRLLISCGANLADEGAFSLAMEKNCEIFDMLLREYSSSHADKMFGFGGSLLIAAIKTGDATLLGKMLAVNFDIHDFSAERRYSVNALGFAIMRARQGPKERIMLRKLLHHGDPNSIVFRASTDNGKIIKTALLVAIETRGEPIVNLFLEKGADVHRPAEKGLKRTPLQLACEIGSFQIVNLLLEHGASVNELPAQRGGATALQSAVKSGSIKIAGLLLSRGALVHADPAKVGGHTAIEVAAEHGRMEMISVLWNAVAGSGFSAEQIEKARNLALSNGHRGCAEIIDNLSPEGQFSFPS